MVIEPTLTEEIEQVRKQINSLTNRRSTLSSALLSSSRIQKRLQHHRTRKAPPTQSATSPSPNTTIASAQSKTLTNLHRLASSITTFPFTDPSPTPGSSRPLRLLGVRIDIPRHDPSSGGGRYGAPYYILLRRHHRAGKGSGYSTVYRHTIPAFVPIRELEHRFLPRPSPELDSEDDDDDGDAVGDPHQQRSLDSEGGAAPRQDLHGLVNRVRHALVSWTLRRASILRLQGQLGLPQSLPLADSDETTTGITHDSPFNSEESPLQNSTEQGKFGVTILEATSYDCRFISIKWANGRAGRVETDDSGGIRGCVVHGEEGRERTVERILALASDDDGRRRGRGKGRVEDLAGRLRDLNEQEEEGKA